jgi:acetyltransferase-like isoleucine patch superfamily enzyme
VLISRDARIHNADQIEIGDNSRIDDFCSLSGKITIGKNVHIASFGLLAGGEPGIFINNFSGCAYGVKIFTQNVSVTLKIN